MEAIDFVTQWVGYLLVIIPVGAGAMVTYQAFVKTTTDDSTVIDDANKKIRQTIKGAIIGFTISGLIEIIKSYYF